MKTIIFAVLATLTLSACGVTTGQLQTKVDEFTGTTVVSTPEACNAAVGYVNYARFCMSAEKREQEDLGKLTFSYYGDGWLFMNRAEVKFEDDPTIYVLFESDRTHREVRYAGKVREWYTVTWKLSEKENNKAGYAEFVREGERRKQAGQTVKTHVRVYGSNYYQDFKG